MRNDSEGKGNIKNKRLLSCKQPYGRVKSVCFYETETFTTTSMVVFLVAAACFGLCFFGASCTDTKRKEFIYAYQDRVVDAVSIIAVEKVFFRQEGLSLIPRMFSSGPECMEALISGSAAFGTMGDETAIIVGSKKGDSFKIVCALGNGEHRHRIIVSNNSGITKIADLEGRRIGVKKGTSTHGGLVQFEKRHGIDINDEMVELPPSLQLTALVAGEIDAIAASEPTPSQAEAGGYGRELATLGNLNNTYPVLLVVNSDFAKRNPEIVAGVIRALARAEAYIKDHFDESAMIISHITGLNAEVTKKAMGYHRYGVILDDETVDGLRATSNFLKEIGNITELPDFDRVVDRSYMERSLFKKEKSSIE